MDSAGYWQTLRDVILPLLKPVILLALLLRSMDLLRIFDQIFILHPRWSWLRHRKR